MIDKRIVEIFFDIFRVRDISIETNRRDISEWDSLGHMRLIALIEKRFDIRFEYSEIIGIFSVKEIQDYLIKKDKI